MYVCMLARKVKILHNTTTYDVIHMYDDTYITYIHTYINMTYINKYIYIYGYIYIYICHDDTTHVRIYINK